MSRPHLLDAAEQPELQRDDADQREGDDADPELAGDQAVEGAVAGERAEISAGLKVDCTAVDILRSRRAAH